MDASCRVASRGASFGGIRFGGTGGRTLFALSLLFGALAACASVESAPVDPFESDPGSSFEVDRSTSRTPSWASMPLSWAKLGAIETWLTGPSARNSNFWWVEGQLALAEGRLEFARQDLASAGSSRAVVERINASRLGLKVVETNSRATDLQRDRASRALASLERLKVGPYTTGSSRAIPRSTWRARAPRRNQLTPSGNRYTRITIHHSADSITPQLDGTQGSSAIAIRKIQQVHMNSSKDPYGDIGYHFVIDPSGRLFEGRELRWQGAHAKGANNRANIGICVLGNFEHGRPSRAALATLERTLGDLRGRYNIARNQVYGHLDFRNTLCPGEHLMHWVRSYSGRRH